MKKLICFSSILLLVLICSFLCATGARASEVSSGDNSVQLRSQVTVLGDFFGKPTVTAYFFAEELSEDEKEIVTHMLEFQLEKKIGKSPIATILFIFKENSTQCNFKNLLSYGITFNKSDTFPIPITTKQMALAYSVSDLQSYGVMDISGDLEVGKTFQAHIKYETVITKEYASVFSFAPEAESLPLRWDITIDSHIRLKK